ncbi:MAG: hypothetical protein KGP10_06680 [Actinomycetales bacterium]|nr:hypothetical protein [Actinomycetales bacterium]
MARRQRRATRDSGVTPRPAEAEGEVRAPAHRQVESHADGDWVVQAITGATSTKPYRCPGCDQPIPPATPHLVAWPAEGSAGLAERRHWHRACWRSRLRRR